MIKSAITDIDVRDSVALITVNGLSGEGHLLARIFKTIADRGIDVDMITLCPHHKDRMNLSFTISNNDLGGAVAAMGELRADIPRFLCHISSNNSKITLSGTAVFEEMGIVSDVMSILTDNSVSVKLICASVNEISLLVDESDVDTALAELNKKYMTK